MSQNEPRDEGAFAAPSPLSRAAERKATTGRITLGLLGAALIAAGAMLEFGGSIVALAIIGVIMLMGWPTLLAVRHATRIRTMIALVLLVALGVANWGTPEVMSLVVALAVAGSFGVNMLPAKHRTQVLEQAGATFTGSLLAVTVAMWAFVWDTALGQAQVLIFAAVIAVAAILESIETRISHLLAFINGIAVGIFGAWLGDLPLWVGAAIGLCVVLCYVLTERAVREAPRPSPMLAGSARALIPHCALGMAAYVLALVIV